MGEAMRKEDMMIPSVTIILAVTAIVLSSGCGAKKSDDRIIATSRTPSGEKLVVERPHRSADNGAVSGEKPVAFAPTRDIRVILHGFDLELAPAGKPLTDDQKKRITDTYNPSSDTDLRQILGVLTKDQKMVFVNDICDRLAKTDTPLTKKQENRMMSIGPGTKDTSWQDVLTPEQRQQLIQNLK